MSKISFLIAVICLLLLQFSYANGNEEMCDFRYVTINNKSVNVSYYIGKNIFSKEEIKNIVVTLKRYKIDYVIYGKRIKISCELYDDLDYLHNITRKSGVILE